jgi:hypothetical protein
VTISAKEYSNWVVLAFIIALVVVPIVMYISKKRGANILSNKYLLSLGAAFVFPFIILPLWFTDMSVAAKCIGTLLSLGFGLSNYFVLDLMRRRKRDGSR